MTIQNRSRETEEDATITEHGKKLYLDFMTIDS
jgi:hypothetical protein